MHVHAHEVVLPASILCQRNCACHSALIHTIKRFEPTHCALQHCCTWLAGIMSKAQQMQAQAQLPYPHPQ
jgi:hypothetical protein